MGRFKRYLFQTGNKYFYSKGCEGEMCVQQIVLSDTKFEIDVVFGSEDGICLV